MPSPETKKNSRRYRDERRQYVSDTLRMRLTISEALAYMEDKGYPLAQATLERDKKLLQQNKIRKLYNIARTGFADQHTERLELLEMAERELFANYRAEKSPFKRAIIIEKIIQLQPYISGYYESCKEIMEESQELKKMINDLSIKEEVLIINSHSNTQLEQKDEEEEEEVVKEKDVENRSTQKEDNILSNPRGTEQEESPGTREDPEDAYRRTKAKGIFFNPS